MLARRALVRTAVVLAALTACSAHSSKPGFPQPAADRFQPGPCRAVATAVLMVGKDAHALATGSRPDAAISTRMKQNQDLIDASKPGLDADLMPSFNQLVIGIGIVRIRSDSNTFDRALAQELVKDYQAVITACTR